MTLFRIIREAFTDRGTVTERCHRTCPDCRKPATLVTVIQVGHRSGRASYETYVPPAKGQPECYMCGGVLVPKP